MLLQDIRGKTSQHQRNEFISLQLNMIMMTVSYVFCISYNIAGSSDVLSQDEEKENEKRPLDPTKRGCLSL